VIRGRVLELLMGPSIITLVLGTLVVIPVEAAEEDLPALGVEDVSGLLAPACDVPACDAPACDVVVPLGTAAPVVGFTGFGTIAVVPVAPAPPLIVPTPIPLGLTGLAVEPEGFTVFKAVAPFAVAPDVVPPDTGGVLLAALAVSPAAAE
jgi:hypothetical protein